MEDNKIVDRYYSLREDFEDAKNIIGCKDNPCDYLLALIAELQIRIEDLEKNK